MGLQGYCSCFFFESSLPVYIGGGTCETYTTSISEGGFHIAQLLKVGVNVVTK